MAKKKPLSSKIKKALGAAGKKWKKTDAAAGSSFINEAVEDGTYESVICGAALQEIGGKAAVVLSYKITDDEAENEIVASRYFLETAQNLAYLKRDLGKYVDDVDDLDLSEALEDTLEEIAASGAAARITVKMAGEFQNVYLGKVDVDGADDDDDEDDDEDDDDKPAKKKPKKGAKAAGGKGGGKKGGKASADDDEDEDDDEAEDDDEDDDDEAPEIAKGDSVFFTPPRSKKAKKCEVKKVAGGKANLEDEDGNKYPGIVLSKLELIDEDNDSEDDDEDDDEDEAPKKPKKGSKKPAPAKGKKGKKAAEDDDEDDDDEDDDEDEVEIEAGSKVSVNFKGKEYTGKVKEIDTDDETVTVKFKAGDKTITKAFPMDKVEAVI